MNIIPDPQNRPDGRHWCNPASADITLGEARCPECGTVWSNDGTNVWFEKTEE